MPISLIGNAVGRIFYKTVADNYNEGNDIGEMVYNFIKRLLILSYVPAVVLIAAADYLIEMMFGKQWAIAGLYVRILCLYFVLWFKSVSTTGILVIKGKLKQNWLFTKSCT